MKTYFLAFTQRVSFHLRSQQLRRSAAHRKTDCSSKDPQNKCKGCNASASTRQFCIREAKKHVWKAEKPEHEFTHNRRAVKYSQVTVPEQPDIQHE